MSHSLVTGATGLIGRWLVPELTRLGRDVVALVRRADERRAAYLAWVARHGGAPERVTLVEGDLAAAGLGLDARAKELAAAPRDVYHLGGLMQFGMTEPVARAANVDGTQALLDLVATPALRRFVLVGGFKIGDGLVHRELGLDTAGPYRPADYAPLYRALGGYEASKLETDHLVQHAARTRGLSLSRVHPGAVLGDSRTGETTQLFGFAPIVQALYRGKMPAIPGGAAHWLPLVTVDFLAALLARVPDAAPGNFIVHDDASPMLDELVARIAEHLGVPAPRRRVPIGLVRALMRAHLVPRDAGDPEGLAFLADRRYDTTSTRQLAADLGIAWPSLDEAIARNIDHAIATRFLARPAPTRARMVRVAGAPAYVTGDRAAPEAVLLHGLPLDADSWDALALPGRQLRVDLPGLGRSAAAAASPREWMESLLADARGPLHLVGHSLGTRYALEFAAAHPERVARLVLISPFFLQAPPPAIMRRVGTARLAAHGLRRSHLEKLVTGDARATSPVLDGPVADLARPGARARWGAQLASAHRHRGELQALLRDLMLPVLIIHGANDPLVAPTSHEVLRLDGTGHFPQLDRPAEVRAAIERFLAAERLRAAG
jgi:pimeloyl-ACP methyl ester carboxylesterase/nucleoside-diphosphate-sugar epimerase